jgi:hypothetical protein
MSAMTMVTRTLPATRASLAPSAPAASLVVRRPVTSASFSSVLRREAAGRSSARTLPPPLAQANREAPALPDPQKETEDVLDPLRRRRAALAPPEWLGVLSPTLYASPQALLTGAASPRPAAAASSLEELVPSLVRRIAWAGDRHRGSVRLELGAGELAGAILLVHADGGRVQVQVSAPPGTDTVAWQKRLSKRIAARGIPIDGVEVT